MFFKGKTDFLVVGLGNPGSEYSGTRHNCGFAALDYAARKFEAKVIRKRFSGLFGSADISGRSAILLKPLTYMNLSGNSVGEAARFYKIPVGNIVVICDDISLPCGTIRIRPHGSAGGHNGLKSIIYALGSDEFTRIKIGVGSDRGNDLKDYVLGKPDRREAELIEGRFGDIAAAIELIAAGRIEQAMSQYNAVQR